MINVEQMLNIGRDCGLNTVYEAWSQVQSHWDAFFSYANFYQEQTDFNQEMFDKGLLELNETGETKYKWPEVEETIVDAMNRLGMAYVEPNLDGMCGCPCDDYVFDEVDSLEEGDGVL